MSKQQKRILAVMAVVMVLILGGVVFMVLNANVERNTAAFQAQLDSLKHENDLKLTNIAVNH